MNLRYSINYSSEKIKKELGIEVPFAVQPNYNIAPTHGAYVITNEHPERLQKFKWGLIPSSASDDRFSANHALAMREGIQSKNSFRFPIRRKRCLVIADSFYVWKQTGKTRIPYRIYVEGQINVFAGIWDLWNPSKGVVIPSFSIITIPATGNPAQVTSRMPFLLPTDDIQKYWLQDISLEEVNKVLDLSFTTPYQVYRIGDAINDLKNNTPLLHKPVNDSPDLFTLG